MQRNRARLGILMMGLSMLLASCATNTNQLAPGAMQVGVDVKDYQLGTTQVAIHFADQHNNTIEFVHGETVTCNGVFLAYDSGFFAHAIGYGAYTGQVPLQPADGKYTFVYTPASGNGNAVTVIVPVVHAPMQIAAPANGARVALPKTVPLVVTYPPSGLASTGIFGIVTDSRGHSASALTLDEPGSLTFKVSDMQNFQPGPGSISLARITTGHVQGTAFASVGTSYENIQTEVITWY
jgi:hypothetical protein